MKRKVFYALVTAFTLAALLSPRPLVAQLATPPGFAVGTSGQSCSGSSVQYGWPDANGQILKCSSNVWSVVTQTAGAAGSNGQVQWNSSGALGASGNFYWDDTNIRLGIGTSTVTKNIGLEGSTGRSIGMEASPIGVGSSLTIQAANALSGSTNLNGGNLVLAGGQGTGNSSGGGQILFQTTTNGSSGASYESLSTRMSISGNNGGVQINTTFSPPTDILTVGGNIDIFSNPASSTIGGLNFRALNASGTQYNFSGVYGGVTSKVAGAENGYLGFAVEEAGTNAAAMMINDVGGVSIGSGYVAALGTTTAPANGLIVQGNVAIGSSKPLNALDVAGGHVVGAGYVGTTTAPANGMVVQGNVGVGTNAPSHTLEVNGAGTFRISNGNQPADYYADFAVLWAGSHPFSLVVDGARVAQELIGAYYGTTYSTSLMYGNIGIGTTAPLNKLDVYGITGGGVAIGSAYAGNYTASANGLIVQGSTGIGTNSPLATLDVNGAIDVKGLNGISLPAADSGLNSVAIGPGALANIALGGSAAYKNTAVGASALANIQFSTGTANTAVGYGALSTAGAAGSNTGIGYLSMQNATSGGANTAVGVTSLFSVGGGGSNVAVGYIALRNVSASSGNIGIGAGAGATTSGGGITSGANNIVIGPNVASTTLNTGSNNILIGGSSAVDTPTPGTSNFLNIGNLIYGTSIGTAATPGNVGIGTSTPAFTLQIIGTAANNSDSGSGGLAISDSVNTNKKLFLGYDRTVGSNGVGFIQSAFSGTTYTPLFLNAHGGRVVVNNSAVPLSTFEAYGNASIGTYAGSYAAPTNGLIVSGNVGIGTTAPLNALDVAGGHVIGAGYVGIITAPANGLVVQGNTGIGSTSPVATLDVNGQIYGHGVSISTTTVNWAQGNVQGTSQSCSAFSFSGMQDGGSYSLAILGTTSGTCSFSNTDSPSLTFKMPSNHGSTTASTMTLYHFIRQGTNVFVSWLPGY